MDATGSHESNRAYYDAFAERYEDMRGENDPGGYHELLDELETRLRSAASPTAATCSRWAAARGSC